MVAYLLLAGSLSVAAPPADPVAEERFALASANLELDRIRYFLQQLSIYSSSSDFKARNWKTGRSDV